LSRYSRTESCTKKIFVTTAFYLAGNLNKCEICRLGSGATASFTQDIGGKGNRSVNLRPHLIFMQKVRVRGRYALASRLFC